ncbi:MAG: tetraacyldisaccharide 4'-kinase [Bacteroidota bacterium]
MRFRAILLFPFSMIFALILSIRHALFDFGILKSREAELPIIRIGNLALGGTGKTPFTEYILHSFSKEFQLGVVSRGYGRKNRDLREVCVEDSALISGDEPLQIKRKFPQTPIFLNSNRFDAIKNLREKYADLQLAVLDDALQHRKLRGGFKILLTDIARPFYEDWLVPSGYLRDLKSRAHDVDVIVMTKMNENQFSSVKAAWIKEALKEFEKPVFFTAIAYKEPKAVFDNDKLFMANQKQALLVTGIANSNALYSHLDSQNIDIDHLNFSDHHNYSESDLFKIRKKYQGLQNDSVIFTTEKDAQRLRTHEKVEIISDLPIYSIGIEVKFLQEEEEFKSLIKAYVREN